MDAGTLTIQRPDPGWRWHAACREHPTLPWVEDRPSRAALRDMRAVCASCPVRDECLQDALVTEQQERVRPVSVRGGLTGVERASTRTDLPHGKAWVYVDRGCRCDACRRDYAEVRARKKSRTDVDGEQQP